MRVLCSVGRAIVFVVGAVFGYLTASVISYYGGGSGPLVVIYLRIYSPLVLALAAPICWYFAVRGKAGDRWTLGYIGAWVAWYGIGVLATLIF